MSFDELNSVEHYIIHQLSGVNLNSNIVQEPTSSMEHSGSLSQQKKSEEALMK